MRQAFHWRGTARRKQQEKDETKHNDSKTPGKFKRNPSCLGHHVFLLQKLVFGDGVVQLLLEAGSVSAATSTAA